MINHKGTSLITTERLLARKILPEDAEMLFAWMSDPEVCKYERWNPHPNIGFSRGYILEAFDEYKSNCTYQWGIQLETTLIGSVSVVSINDNDQKAVLGYCLARKYWSNGYASEAVKAVLNFIFTEVGLNRIEATHSKKNIASGKVLKKVGMTLEGCAKEYYYCNSEFHDSNLYGMTKTSFKAT